MPTKASDELLMQEIVTKHSPPDIENGKAMEQKGHSLETI